jgi:UPF0042 nucleotide-binding protein
MQSGSDFSSTSGVAPGAQGARRGGLGSRSRVQADTPVVSTIPRYTTSVRGVEEVVLITGLSGAGRSQAGNTLEDLGWFVIDNMPVELLAKVAELGRVSESDRQIALVAGTGADLASVMRAVEELRHLGIGVKTLFLDASTPVLVRRYSETRRRHPVFSEVGSVEAAIEAERDRLSGLREAADLVIDTSELTVHDLRRRITAEFGQPEDARTRTNLVSFGYKHGVPGDADLVFDCRFLPNPYWDPELRALTGLDDVVQAYVMDSPLADQFVNYVQELLEFLIAAFDEADKSVMTVAFGCTGGRHRSVTMVELFAAWLRESGREPHVRHRDVDR